MYNYNNQFTLVYVHLCFKLLHDLQTDPVCHACCRTDRGNLGPEFNFCCLLLHLMISLTELLEWRVNCLIEAFNPLPVV